MTLAALWVGLPLTKDANFTALQNDMFAVPGRRTRTENSRSLSLRRYKFRPMPIYTSSEMVNYDQLRLGFFGKLDTYFLRTGSVHFMFISCRPVCLPGLVTAAAQPCFKPMALSFAN